MMIGFCLILWMMFNPYGVLRDFFRDAFLQYRMPYGQYIKMNDFNENE
jgi:hypothetical protein